MARPNKLKTLEAEKGDLESIILPLVNSEGQRGAAKKLGVSESTICEWLQRNRYVRIVRYEKYQEQAS